MNDLLLNEQKAAVRAATRELDELFGAAPVHRRAATTVSVIIDASASMRDVVSKVQLAISQLQADLVGLEQYYWSFASRDTLRRVDDPTRYNPQGMTALYDAVIDSDRIIATETPHDNVVVIIITDGDDNDSRRSLGDLAMEIDKRRAAGWQFYVIVLGSDVKLSTFDRLKVPYYQASDISDVVGKITDGVFGYLETGVLLIE